MPNNKRGKSNNRGSGKKGKKGQMTIPQTFQPPQRDFKVFMGYNAQITIQEPSAGTGGIYQFRLNSVYDPDYSSTGSVAQGFTSYTGMYYLFRVMRVRAVVRAYSGTTGNMTVGFVPGGNTTVTSNYGYLAAQPFARSAVLQGNTGGEHSVKEWNQVIDIPKVLGVTKQQYLTDFDYTHAVATNPARSCLMNLFIAGHSASPQAVGFTVRLVYEVLLSQPADIVTN